MMLRLGLWLADLLARSLPGRLGYALATLGGIVWHRGDPQRRAVVTGNLARVCAATGRPTSGRAFNRMVRRAFVEHARYYLELLRAPHYPAHRIGRHVSVVDWERHAPRLRTGRGTVIASLHLGNFEPFGTFLAGHGLKGVAPVEVIRPRALFDFLRARRGGGRGVEVVPLSEARKPMLNALRRGEIAALIADRDLVGRGVPVSLFGHQTTMPSGPATLATLTGSQLAVACCLRRGPDRFEAVGRHPCRTCFPGRRPRVFVCADDFVAAKPGRFDIVLLMFAVLGYQLEDSDVEATGGTGCDGESRRRYEAELEEAAAAQPAEPRDLPQVREQLVDLVSQVSSTGHLRLAIVALTRCLTFRNLAATSLVPTNTATEGRPLMEAFARAMIRYRWFVLATWLVVVVSSAIASSGLNDLLTNRFVLPGAESERAGNILKDEFGQRPEGSFSVVVKGKPGSAESLVQPTRAAAARAAGALETGRVAGVRPVSADVVSATIVSELQPADAKGYTGAMREAAGDIPGATLYVTGQSAIEHDLEPVQNRDLLVGEVLEVFVIDNASTKFDPSAVEQAYPDAHIIANSENVGFARASNQGLRRASGRYLLLLNPDAFVAPDTLRLMLDYMDRHPDVGCATCRLELPDGTLDVACRRAFPTPLRSLFRVTLLSKLFPRQRKLAQYNMTYLDEWEETEIDQPCGAFMMVRSEVAQSVGLLSERYFLYCEDTDWAYRIKNAGWRITYTPITTVRHLKRRSSRLDPASAIRHFHAGMRTFYDEHYRPLYPLPVTVLVHLGITLREWLQLAGTRLGWIR
jgi:GT2 family glycosyltransferase/lauroyl/myristoyl acyltransferase